MSRFSFELAGKEQARNFWESSPLASVFNHPDVLPFFVHSVDWWLASKGKEPFCLWPVCLGENGVCKPPGILYYIGPIWSRAGLSIPTHRQLADHLRIYNGLISRFIEKYGRIFAQLPPGLHDVRAFDWWNYHEPDKPRFAIRPRYTACISGLQQLERQGIVAGFREVRQKEIRRLQRKGPPGRVFDWNREEVLNFYSRVMGPILNPSHGARPPWIEALMDLVEKGWGDVLAFRNPEDGELSSILLMLRAKKTCNMVLNATDPNSRKLAMNPWTIYSGILLAKDRGDDLIDFNGANSPRRGDDKQSFGALPHLYFEIEY